MTTAILPRKIPNLEGLGQKLTARQDSIARNFIKKQFEEIVAPFDSRIKFAVRNNETPSTYTTNIAPTEDEAGTNAAGTPVTSRELFHWLDEGTSIRYVGMPTGFDNETSPNSIVTRAINSYERKDIYFLKNPVPGIEGRNFLKQVFDLYKNVYRLHMSQEIKRYLILQKEAY